MTLNDYAELSLCVKLEAKTSGLIQEEPNPGDMSPSVCKEAVQVHRTAHRSNEAYSTSHLLWEDT